MEIITDLKRVLWHEIGHLCVDKLESDANNNFTIREFWVSYHKEAIPPNNWGGGVKMLPTIKMANLVDDVEKTAYAILGSISGCIFETIYRNVVLKSDSNFSDCFCFAGKCAGKMDFNIFHSILSQLRLKYGRDKSFVEFTEVHLNAIYYKAVSENSEFISRITEFIDSYCKIIMKQLDDFSGNLDFFYLLKEKGLDEFITEVSKIATESNLRNSIIEIKDIILQEMLGDI